MDIKQYKDAEKIYKKIVERERFLEVLKAKYKSTLTVKVIQKDGFVDTAELRIDRQSDLFKAIAEIVTEELEKLRKEFSRI